MSGGNPIGTIVRCIGSTGLNPPNATLVAVGVNVHPEHVTAEGETVVFATGSSEPAPDANRLLECAGDLDLSYCAWLQVSASACPEYPGLDRRIWCNGFEGSAAD